MTPSTGTRNPAAPGARGTGRAGSHLRSHVQPVMGTQWQGMELTYRPGRRVTGQAKSCAASGLAGPQPGGCLGRLQGTSPRRCGGGSNGHTAGQWHREVPMGRPISCPGFSPRGAPTSLGHSHEPAVKVHGTPRSRGWQQLPSEDRLGEVVAISLADAGPPSTGKGRTEALASDHHRPPESFLEHPQALGADALVPSRCGGCQGGWCSRSAAPCKHNCRELKWSTKQWGLWPRPVARAHMQVLHDQAQLSGRTCCPCWVGVCPSVLP